MSNDYHISNALGELVYAVKDLKIVLNGINDTLIEIKDNLKNIDKSIENK